MYHGMHGFMFCVLLFSFVIYVYLLLCVYSYCYVYSVLSIVFRCVILGTVCV